MRACPPRCVYYYYFHIICVAIAGGWSVPTVCGARKEIIHLPYLCIWGSKTDNALADTYSCKREDLLRDSRVKTIITSIQCDDNPIFSLYTTSFSRKILKCVLLITIALSAAVCRYDSSYYGPRVVQIANICSIEYIRIINRWKLNLGIGNNATDFDVLPIYRLIAYIYK